MRALFLLVPVIAAASPCGGSDDKSESSTGSTSTQPSSGFTTSGTRIGEEPTATPGTNDRCPSEPTIGCAHSDDACVTDLVEDYPCGQPSASGAHVDLYQHPGESTVWVSSTIEGDECPDPYYALVHFQTPAQPGSVYPWEEIRYEPLYGGCPGFDLWTEGATVEILDVLVEEPPCDDVPIVCPETDGDTNTGGLDDTCGVLPDDGGFGALGIYHLDLAQYPPEDPQYWYLHNGTGCVLQVTYELLTANPYGSSFSEAVVVYGGDSHGLGPGVWHGDKDVQGENDFRIVDVTLLPSCAYTQACPDGQVCAGHQCYLESTYY